MQEGSPEGEPVDIDCHGDWGGGRGGGISNKQPLIRPHLGLIWAPPPLPRPQPHEIFFARAGGRLNVRKLGRQSVQAGRQSGRAKASTETESMRLAGIALKAS